MECVGEGYADEARGVEGEPFLGLEVGSDSVIED